MSVSMPLRAGRDAKLEVPVRRAGRAAGTLWSMVALSPLRWRAQLVAARCVGAVARFLVTSWWPRLALVTVLAAGLAVGPSVPAPTAAICALIVVALLVAARGARTRIVVQEVRDYGRTAPDASKPVIAAGAATLLVDELRHLCDHYRGIHESRPNDLDVDRSKPLEATVSIDAFDETLRSAVSKERSITIGGFAVPIGTILGLLGQVCRGPTLAVALHEQDGTRLLTAQLTMPGTAMRRWRVERTPGGPDASATSSVLQMVFELAQSIFVELSLGGSVECDAMRHFVDGLDHYRSSLGSREGRMLRLKAAEDELMRALSKDEDYALVTYNLGVVYNALAAVLRDAPYLDAAREAFAESIRRNPRHWRSYYALAASFDPSRHEVVELCRRVATLDPGRAARAQASDLMCLAYGVRGERDHARRCGRAACRLALSALACARIPARGAGGSELAGVAVLAHQAAISLLRLAVLYGDRACTGGRLTRMLARSHSTKLFRLALFTAARYAAPASELEYALRFNYGHAALDRGRFADAIREFLLVSRIKPEDAQCLAHLARAHAKRDAPGDRKAAITYAEHASTLLCVTTAVANPEESAQHDPFRSHDPYKTLVAAYESIGELGSANRIDQRRALALLLQRERKRVREEAGEATTLDNHAEAYTAFEGRVATMLEQHLARSRQDNWQVGHLYAQLGWSRASRVLKLVGTRACAQTAAGHLHEATARLPAAAAAELDVKAIRAVMLARCRKTRAEALREAELAVSADPVGAFARMGLSYVLIALGDWERATAAWEQARLWAPDDFEIHLRLACCHVGLASNAPTVEHRLAALRTARTHALDALTMLERGHVTWITRVRYLLGRLCLDLDDPAAAIGHLRLVESDVQAAPLAGVLVGDAQRLLGRYDLAERCYARAIERGETLRRMATGVPPRGEPSKWTATIKYLTEDSRLLPEILARGHLGIARSIADRGGDAARAENAVGKATAEIKRAELEITRAASALKRSKSTADDGADSLTDDFAPNICALQAERACCSGLIALGRGLRDSRDAASGDLDRAIDCLTEAVGLQADSATYLHLARALRSRAGLAGGDEAAALLARAVACCSHARKTDLTGSGSRDADELLREPREGSA